MISTKNDFHFNNYSKLRDENIVVYRKIRAIVYSDNNKQLLINKYGYFKNYYIDGITLTEFGNNAFTTIGNGDIEIGVSKSNSYIDSFININNLCEISTDTELIYNILISIIFLEKYIGFHCEYILKTIINSSERFNVINHTIEDDKLYEKHYASDMIIYDTLSHKSISIQCKQHTFMASNSKNDYICKNQLLLNDKGIPTYYCFFKNTTILPIRIGFSDTRFILFSEITSPLHPIDDNLVKLNTINSSIENNLEIIFSKLP